MNRRYVLVIAIITACSFLLILFSMWKEAHAPVVQERIVVHPISPYKSAISGLGIVEPSTENISIGSPVQRLIEQIPVKVGMKVKKGDILIRFEDKDLEAELKGKEVDYAIAEAQLQRLEAMPRSEDLVTAEAALKRSQAAFDQAKAQYDMILQLKDPRAISQEEANRRRFALEQAQAQLQQAQGDLDKVKQGAWKPDIEIARLQVLQAKTSAERVKAEINRAIVRSPIDGTVIQVKAHEGEFPSADVTPLMIVGDLDQMYLRVSVNQFDAPYFQSTAPAVAFLRGDARKQFPLEFVRVEPLLVSKQNLTNQINEKVDTQVLQVIYRIKEADHSLYIGEQMDVFIDSEVLPRG
jgi:HlyD family secretion protein